MTTLHPRHIRPLLLEALADTRVVFVAGARQVGKTTLTREIVAGEHPMTVFNLDETATRDAALRDPAGFLATLSGPRLNRHRRWLPRSASAHWKPARALV